MQDNITAHSEHRRRIVDLRHIQKGPPRFMKLSIWLPRAYNYITWPGKLLRYTIFNTSYFVSLIVNTRDHQLGLWVIRKVFSEILSAEEDIILQGLDSLQIFLFLYDKTRSTSLKKTFETAERNRDPKKFNFDAIQVLIFVPSALDDLFLVPEA